MSLVLLLLRLPLVEVESSSGSADAEESGGAEERTGASVGFSAGVLLLRIEGHGEDGQGE